MADIIISLVFLFVIGVTNACIAGYHADITPVGNDYYRMQWTFTFFSIMSVATAVLLFMAVLKLVLCR